MVHALVLLVNLGWGLNLWVMVVLLLLLNSRWGLRVRVMVVLLLFLNSSWGLLVTDRVLPRLLIVLPLLHQHPYLIVMVSHIHLDVLVQHLA